MAGEDIFILSTWKGTPPTGIIWEAIGMRKQSKIWIWIVALIVGAMAGSLIGEATKDAAPWLSKGFTIGIEPPFVLELNILSLTFGFSLQFNLAGAVIVLALILLLGR
jgi:hypothetical protein